MHHFLLWVALFPTSDRLISDFDDQTGTGKPVFSFFTKTVFRGSPGSAVKPHKCVIPTSDDLDVYVSAVEEGVLSLTPTPILSDLINRSHLGGPDWPMSQSLFYPCAKWMWVGRSSLNVVLFLNILLSTNRLNGRGKVYLNLTVGKKVLTDSIKAQYRAKILWCVEHSSDMRRASSETYSEAVQRCERKKNMSAIYFNNILLLWSLLLLLIQKCFTAATIVIAILLSLKCTFVNIVV